MTRRLAALALMLAAAPAAAGDPPAAVAWLLARSGDPSRTASDIGPYPLDGGGILALDPLTGFATRPAPAPLAPGARFHAVLSHDAGHATIAAVALVASDAAPVCGEPLGVVGVDTGLAAILTESDNRALTAYADRLHAAGGDLYDALEPQLPPESFAAFVTLPGQQRLPVASSGHGDGRYQFFRLNDAQGGTVAFYLDFIGDRKGEWIDPAPCANV